jgi:MYXO-CTERM domain-containing protein
VPLVGATKKSTHTGPIVGGVIGGLALLALLALGLFFLVRRRRSRRKTTHVFPGGLDETGGAPPAPDPLPINATPTRDLAQQHSIVTTSPTAHRRLSLVGGGGVVPADEKQALRAFRQVGVIQEEIRHLEEQTDTAHPDDSVQHDDNSTSTNADLMAEIRLLRSQMQAIQQQQLHMQASLGEPPTEGLPGYTTGPS